MENTGDNQYSAVIEGESSDILPILASIENVTDVVFEGEGKFLLTAVEGADIRKSVFLAAAENNLSLLSFAPVDVSLEAVFTRLTQKGGK